LDTDHHGPRLGVLGRRDLRRLEHAETAGKTQDHTHLPPGTTRSFLLEPVQRMGARVQQDVAGCRVFAGCLSGIHGRVGGWRGTACAVLFHPPPAKPCMQLSKHTALQWSPRLISNTVSAFCITHTSTGERSDHLPPFAMWPVFPTSDYY